MVASHNLFHVPALYCLCAYAIIFSEMKKLILVTMMSVILCFQLCCSQEPKYEEDTPDNYLCAIGNTKYLISDFNKFLDNHKVVESGQTVNRDKMLTNIFDLFIEQKIIELKIENEKIDIKQNEVQAFIHNTIETNPDDASAGNAMQLDLLMQKFLLLKLVPNLQISDAEILNYYNDNKDKFFVRERITITQILLEDQQDAEELHNKLSKTPTLMKELAEKKVLENIHTKGVIVATYQKGELPQDIEDYLWKLPVGAINKPYMGGEGDWMIFIVMEKKNAGLAPIEEIKHKIIKKLALLKIDQMSQKLIEDLKKEAGLTIYQKNLDFIYSGKFVDALK
ncbi:MAG: hypothetical protein A2Y62_00345 [Candidatus Fischerbacteria bacterium RBG_13_37_8]|uniref:PpiC domain-containing protein n=1 Tax=Candidatus Fischerbacteria bacterium RBG_13_37_8 TaxID=1817863 RepID=A0A1F5VX69_9BACT|nr:MAG: hypothetical protein A2Y62_00345 [Candidatus Fischerbacteria bacterium RBG_13_37_8]